MVKVAKCEFHHFLVFANYQKGSNFAAIIWNAVGLPVLARNQNKNM